MDKANQVLRRSSIRIRSMSTGHADLNLIISDIKEVRASCKKFTNAQKIMMDDVSKWASKEDNLALQETFHYLSDLSDLWYEAQRQFIGNIKKLQQAFEMILESECHLDKSRNYLASREKQETKLRKECTRERVGPLDLHDINERLAHAVACRDVAQQEVAVKSAENEVHKVVKIKEGMADVSDMYLQLAYKTSVIFSAHSKIVECLPDVNGVPIEDIKYTGSNISRRVIAQAKGDVHNYKRQTVGADAPPPPYTSNPSSPNSSFGFCSNALPPGIYPNQSEVRYCEIPEYDEGHSYMNRLMPNDSFRQNYENLMGAVGGINISQSTHQIRHNQ